MEATRKAWASPQVFVLGAEATEAYKAGGVAENTGHTTLYTKDGLKVTSIDTFTGYES